LNLLDGVTVTLADITATAAEINYLSGVTSAIQDQIDNIPAPPELTQVQVEDDTSAVFGQVSGQRLAQAVAANASGIGSGQTWQDVTASRASSTIYQNTTGKPIMVSIFTYSTVEERIEVSVDNVTFLEVGGIRNSGSNDYGQATLIVPPDHYYKWGGFVGSNNWSELR